MIADLSSIGLPIMYAISYFLLFNGIYLLFVRLENQNNMESPKPDKKYSITVIVPMYNGAKHIKECVDSLLNMDYPKEKVEILVIDDGSTDNSYEIAKKIKGIKAYRKNHAGKSAAVNYGIKKAKGELIGILDVDSSVSQNALIKMVGFFKDKKVAAVHSGLRAKNNDRFIEKFQELEYMFSLFFKKMFSMIDGLYVTPGVFSVFRASVFREIGVFDTSEMSEDLEIAFRIISKKYVIKCAIDAKTYTVVPDKFKDLTRQRVRWNCGLARNLSRYRHLLSTNYGELGYFVLPFTIIGHLTIMVFFSYVLANFTITLINNLILMSIIGVETYLRGMLTFNMAWGFLQSKIFFYTLLTTALGIIFLYYSKKYTGSKKKWGILAIHYTLYIMVAGFVYFYFWIATFYRIFRKDVRW
jgi:cellulose synthase/poly-beta-1,6-N-acetylglucosamine synthase-like glycosyltransferase